MNTGQGQVPKNGLVLSPQDPNLAMGFEDMSMPADRKTPDTRQGGMAQKAWVPVAQGPGAVANLGGQQLGEAGLANQRQAGRGLNPNKAIPNSGSGPNTGAPNGMGGKANNQRRAANNNATNNHIRGAASYNAARMPVAQPAGTPVTPSGENDGADEDLKANGTIPSSPVENPMVTAVRGAKGMSQSPEWVKQEDTSWVDKLLDI